MGAVGLFVAYTEMIGAIIPNDRLAAEHRASPVPRCEAGINAGVKRHKAG